MTDLERTRYMRELRRGVVSHFSLAELQALSFDLSLDWETIPGDEKVTKAQSLILNLARRGRLADLLALLQEERPNVDWPAVPPAAQQVEDEQAIIPDSVREAALQSFLDKMNRHILSKRLVDGGYEPETAAAALAYTQAVFPSLDPRRLVIVIRFLGEIGFSNLLNLSQADLSSANLSGTNLINSYLSGANLAGADLRGAYLVGADLTQADLRGANLKQAHLGEATLRGATYDDKTTWPADFDPKVARCVLDETPGRPINKERRQQWKKRRKNS